MIGRLEVVRGLKCAWSNDRLLRRAGEVIKAHNLAEVDNYGMRLQPGFIVALSAWDVAERAAGHGPLRLLGAALGTEMCVAAHARQHENRVEELAGQWARGGVDFSTRPMVPAFFPPPNEGFRQWGACVVLDSAAMCATQGAYDGLRRRALEFGIVTREPYLHAPESGEFVFLGALAPYENLLHGWVPEPMNNANVCRAGCTLAGTYAGSRADNPMELSLQAHLALRGVRVLMTGKRDGFTREAIRSVLGEGMDVEASPDQVLSALHDEARSMFDGGLVEEAADVLRV